MRFRLVLLALALATPALVAGCVGSKSEPVTGSGTGTGTGSGTGATAQYPAPTPKPTLVSTLTVAPLGWVKPNESFTVEATPPANATGAVTYSWAWGMSPAAGHVHDHAAMLAGKPQPASTGPKFDTGFIDPGAHTVEMAFATEGTYFLHCHPHPWMKGQVIVSSDAQTPAVVNLAILGAGDLSANDRFAPDVLVINPHSKLVVWNNGTAPHTATLEKFEPKLFPLAGTGPKITVTLAMAGDEHVVVVMKDAAGHWGRSEARVVVDPARPDAHKTFDPMTSSFTGAFPDALAPANERLAPPTSHSFNAEYNMSTLHLKFNASSSAPTGGTVKVELYAMGAKTPLFTLDFADKGEKTVTNLASGGYTVKVYPGAGVQIGYTVNVDAMYVLVPPPPGSEATPHTH